MRIRRRPGRRARHSMLGVPLLREGRADRRDRASRGNRNRNRFPIGRSSWSALRRPGGDRDRERRPSRDAGGLGAQTRPRMCWGVSMPRRRSACRCSRRSSTRRTACAARVSVADDLMREFVHRQGDARPGRPRPRAGHRPFLPRPGPWAADRGRSFCPDTEIADLDDFNGNALDLAGLRRAARSGTYLKIVRCAKRHRPRLYQRVSLAASAVSEKEIALLENFARRRSSDGQCAAARRDPSAPGRICASPSTTGRRRRDVRRGASPRRWNKNFQELLDCPTSFWRSGKPMPST